MRITQFLSLLADRHKRSAKGRNAASMTGHSGMRYLALKETGLYLAVLICREAT